MEKMSEILNNFKNTKILVIGDVMLDRYLDGEVSRISAEAPVPIVKINKEFFELGGAANVASNIVTLGGNVHLFGFVGDDKSSEIIKNLLDKKGIKYNLGNTTTTTEKTRLISQGQQLIRFDKEESKNCFFDENSRKNLLELANLVDIIIISDYSKGTINSGLMNLLLDYKKKMIIDPRPINKELYKGVLMITPNKKESLEMSGEKDFLIAGKKLREELECDVLMTIGDKGMILFSEKIINVPTFAKEVFDVTGAGDTSISALSIALAAKATNEEAIIIANHAAGIAVEKKGTYSVTFKELESRMHSEEKKIKNFEEIEKIVQDAKRKGKKIVWTNGCFDLLHVGHIKYLEEAKKLGDILIVGLNSDTSVRAAKGEGKPIQTENDRAEIIASLEFIDYVMIFPEPSVENYLLKLKPEIFAKGGDYSLEKIKHPEFEAVRSYGGELAFLSLIEGKSTTNITEKIKSQNNFQSITK